MNETDGIQGTCPTCGCHTVDGCTTEDLDYAYPTCPDCGSSIID